MSNFRVGQKVVCIDDSPASVYQSGKRLILRAVYDVTGVSFDTPEPSVQVDGHGISGVRMAFGDDWLRASRFRPVHTVATDAAMFQSLLISDPLLVLDSILEELDTVAARRDLP